MCYILPSFHIKGIDMFKLIDHAIDVEYISLKIRRH